MQDCHFFFPCRSSQSTQERPIYQIQSKALFSSLLPDKTLTPSASTRSSLCVCACSGPWQLLVSDNLLSSSSAHVCNVNDCFDDLHVFFQCVSVELKRYTIFNKKLQASGLMEKSTHSFPLPCTNISRAAGEFVYTNKLRAAS